MFGECSLLCFSNCKCKCTEYQSLIKYFISVNLTTDPVTGWRHMQVSMTVGSLVSMTVGSLVREDMMW